MAEFKERLEQAMILRDMKAIDLSKQTGIGEGAISQYRKGAYKASQKNLEKIADALKVPIPWLMGLDFPDLPGELIDVDDTGKFPSQKITGADVEFFAFDEFLSKLGLDAFIDLARFGGEKGRDGDVWIVKEKRSKTYYSATTEELNKLADRVLAYTKYQIYEFISGLNKLDESEVPISRRFTVDD